MWCCVVWHMAPISDEQAVYTRRRQHLNKILMSIYQTARHHTTDVSNLHSHFLISEDVTRCDYVSLGRLFLTNERILVPSKRELLAHQHTVTYLTTCIFSNTTVTTSHLMHRELIGFWLLHAVSYCRLSTTAIWRWTQSSYIHCWVKDGYRVSPTPVLGTDF